MYTPPPSGFVSQLTMPRGAVSLKDRGTRDRGLTTKQETFARAYVASGSARGAALEAGYSQSVADNATREVLGSTAVSKRVSELREETRKQVALSLAGAAQRAVRCLVEIVEDADSPATARVAAANSLLDRSGFERGLELGEDAHSDEFESFLRSVGRED